MNSDMATAVAERCIEYYYDKIQEENLRKYNRIQKKKELRRKKYQTVGGAFLLLVMIVLCMSIIWMEVRLHNQVIQAAELQSEINSITSENADAKKRLENAADYEWIEQEAKKLGMTYPSADMVVYYETPDEDYMIQTEEIPEN